MKTIHWIALLLITGMFALAACSKSPKPSKAVDDWNNEIGKVYQMLPKFEQAFPGNPPNEAVKQVSMNVHYQQYDAALKGLETLANNPGLSEEQKTAVAELTDEVKKLMAKKPAPPAPPASSAP